VAEFLRDHNLSAYTKLFETQAIDFETLLTLTEVDLEKLGISQFGIRRKIVRAIAAIERKVRRYWGSESESGMSDASSTTTALPPHVMQRWVHTVSALNGSGSNASAEQQQHKARDTSSHASQSSGSAVLVIRF
jgi:hypothetical protein